jgi:hypothetical protein
MSPAARPTIAIAAASVFVLALAAWAFGLLAAMVALWAVSIATLVGILRSEADERELRAVPASGADAPAPVASALPAAPPAAA